MRLQVWLLSLAGKCLVLPPLHQDIVLHTLTSVQQSASVIICNLWSVLQAPAAVQALGTIFAVSAITGDCMSYDFSATEDQPAAAAMLHKAGELHVRVDVSSTPTWYPGSASLPQSSATPCLGYTLPGVCNLAGCRAAQDAQDVL